MQSPSPSPAGGSNPMTPTKTRPVRHCRSFPGTKPWMDSPSEAPEYTSLKDIIPDLSTSPPSGFWGRIPLPTTPRRRPRPCTCSTSMEVLIRKRIEKKVAPADEDAESPLCSYPPFPRSEPLFLDRPQRLCMHNHRVQNSEKCFTCVIWEKMFREVKHVFSKITNGIGKLFTSMRVRKDAWMCTKTRDVEIDIMQ